MSYKNCITKDVIIQVLMTKDKVCYIHMKTIQIPAEQCENDHSVSKILYSIKQLQSRCSYNHSVACGMCGM
jgi:hypothetical protein